MSQIASTNPPCRSCRRLVIAIRTCLALSLLLMIAGHWIVMSAGHVFDPRSNEHYNIVTRWVSDFAAKWPEGWWIKGAILVFCLALAGFFILLFKKAEGSRFEYILKFVTILLATLMIGGLLLVVICDMIPHKYDLQHPPWWARVFGGKDVYVVHPLSAKEWSIRWYHQLGFAAFICGYLICNIWFTVKSWRDPVVAAQFLLAAAITYWLFFTNTAVPGIPQRALLGLIAYWIWHHLPEVVPVLPCCTQPRPHPSVTSAPDTI